MLPTFNPRVICGAFNWMLLASLVLAVVPAYADLTTGLVAYYPFNGNANDASGNGNNGTVNGATLTADRFGKANSAYSFDGVNDHIEVPNSSSLSSLTTSLTIGAWINIRNYYDLWASIVAKSNSSSMSNDQYTFSISQNGQWSTLDRFNDTFVQSLQTGQWHYVAYTWDGSYLKFYLNRNLITTANYTGVKNPNTMPLEIGLDTPGFSEYMDGILDEIRIYNRAITAAEIQQLYQEGITTVPTVSTDSPSLITATSAILKGTVNPNGANTIVNFDFGPTTAYGQSLEATPANVAATAAATSVSADKTGLTCGTTYHYRAKAVNRVGTTNGADKAFTTSACSGDLIVTNITLNPAKPVAGTAFSAVVTVKNQSIRATAASKLKLWANQVAVPTCTTVAPKVADVAAIAAGASVNITVNGLTSNVVGGNTLRTFADGTCVIGETNEANNQRILSYRIVGWLPDLIITNIALTPAVPVKNTVFNVAITVKNQGSNFAGDNFLDVWTNQATTQTCGALGDAWADVSGLAAGATRIISVTGLSVSAGVKSLRAFVDSWCEAVEANETNNQMIKMYMIQ